MQLQQLFPFLKPYRKQAIVGPIFKLAEAVFELIIPLVMSRLIDVGIKNSDFSYVLKMSGLMLLLAAAGLGCAYVCQHSASIASQGYGTSLRNFLFSHINRFSYAELDRFGAATLSTRLTNDINQLQLAVAMLIRLAIRAPFLIIGGLISAILIDAKLALVMVGTMLIFVVFLPIIMVKSIRLYRVVQQKLDRLAVVAGENLSGVRIVRAFAKTPQERKRFDEANSDHSRSAAIVGRLTALSNPMTTLIMNLAILAILWFGGMRVDSGNMTQGEVIAFTNYMSQILLALIVTANLVVLFTKALASAGRVSEVMRTAPSITDSAHPNQMPARLNNSVEFDKVSFAYDEGAEDALHEVSFTVPFGQTIGIIGLTGSGKSTLVHLLPRFYDTTAGQIRIGGIDIRDLPLQKLREAIGFVPQKSVLFSGTIRENIAFGNPSATDEKIYRAAQIAQAAEFIDRLPEGLDTHIERGGVNLSGGQRQRMAIARAIAKNPAILVLDDAASALDYATEAKLRAALRKRAAEQAESMTVFIVSQRIAAVRAADQILVLDEGELIAQGTHTELLQSCEMYRDISRSQTELEEGGA